MSRQKRTIKKKWKLLFYILLTINIIVFLTITLLIFWPVSETEEPTVVDHSEEEGSEFIVRTTKENLNELVNAYVDKFLHDTKHQYSISLEGDVHLQGELPAFSSTVPLSVHLEPIVQDNGDVIRKQESISIGLLELPNKNIMEYITQSLPMPECVTVNPEKEQIYVAVTPMDLKSNFKVVSQRTDSEANNLASKIKVPYTTSG